MKIQMALVRWFVLLVCFLPSFSRANYNGFPLESPRVTGTFMEYRPATRTIGTHFHGGIDFKPGQGVSNNIVLPVADGNLTYQIHEHEYTEDGITKKDTTYTLWIRHDTGPYAGFGTRYRHVGEYPAARSDHPDFHQAGDSHPRPEGITTSDTLGTIVTPHDPYDDHLHFEVFRRSDLAYINPLSKFGEAGFHIADNRVDYSADGWDWVMIDDDGFYDTIDATEIDASARGIPRSPTRFRVLFKGFDRINTTTNSLGFYSIKAWLKKYKSNRDTVTIFNWSFTADMYPARLRNWPYYILNDRNSVDVDIVGDDDSRPISTERAFYYRLFAHEDDDLSIERGLFCENVDPPSPCFGPDTEGYIDIDITSKHFFEVEVTDYANRNNEDRRVTKRLSIPIAAIGDFLHAFTATAGDRQVTLDWTFERPGTSWNHFKIQRSQDSGVSFTDLATVPYEPTPGDGCLHPSTDPEKPGCNFEYVDETATEDIIYFYRLLTGELVGSSWSTEDTYGPPDWMVQARPNGGDPVPVPSGPVIFIDKVDVGSFVLYIDSGANYADHYRIEYGPLDQSFPWSTRVEGTKRKTVSDERLTEGRRYKVRLVGFNSAGRGTESNVEQFSLGEVPAIDGPAERTVTENYAVVLGVYTVSGTATWSLSGADAAAFDLAAASSQASLSFSPPPNYEAPTDTDEDGTNTYHVTIEATPVFGASSDEGTLADFMAAFQKSSDEDAPTWTKAVMVRVEDGDDPGVVELPSRPPRAGVSLRATFEEEDEITLGTTEWTWASERWRKPLSANLHLKPKKPTGSRSAWL